MQGEVFPQPVGDLGGVVAVEAAEDEGQPASAPGALSGGHGVGFREWGERVGEVIVEVGGVAKGTASSGPPRRHSWVFVRENCVERGEKVIRDGAG